MALEDRTRCTLLADPGWLLEPRGRWPHRRVRGTGRDGAASGWTWDGVKYVNTGEWLPENEIQALCMLIQVNNPTA